MKYYLKIYCPRPGVYTSNSLVFIRILVSDHKPLASWLPFISIVLPFVLPLASDSQGEAKGKPKVKDWKPTLEIFNEIQL